MLERYPKISHWGDNIVAPMFQSPEIVEVTEKVDGSQFRIAINPDGTLEFGSKSINYDDLHPVDRMFAPAVAEISEVLGKFIIKGEATTQIMGEYFRSTHHNTLSYGRVPKHNVMVYGYKVDDRYFKHDEMMTVVPLLDLEAVPLLWRGPGNELTTEILTNLMKTDSCLGKEKIEGVVAKSYSIYHVSGYLAGTLMMAKYVRPEFQERNKAAWNAASEAKDTVNRLIDEYHAEGRWLKAIQHLKDMGKLTGNMRDIPVLFEEVQNDIQVEDKERISKTLYDGYIKDICRGAVRGLPEYYKDKLTGKV